MGIRRGWKHHFRRDEAKLFGSKNIETGRTLERDTLNFQFHHRVNLPHRLPGKMFSAVRLVAIGSENVTVGFELPSTKSDVKAVEPRIESTGKQNR